MTGDPAQSTGRRRLPLILVGGIAGLTVGLAGVYGISRMLGNAGVEAACRPTMETARRVAPFARGEVAAVNIAVGRPIRLPDMTFRDGSGAERRLSDWKGRTVLFNLWATWCVPCRKEMPALDELQARLGGAEFEVVAVNIDTRDPEKPRAWLKEVGIERLAYYADPSARVFQDLKQVGKAWGMPTTLLVDAAGCEIGTLAGPAEWASEDAIRLVRAALGQTGG
ncbi:MAG: TlpA family protein disulfide reductase [Hyphomicrobiales bacterium]|nr:TlpA family protein disulfide reductase [Hyphomicrobiales bacterium]